MPWTDSDWLVRCASHLSFHQIFGFPASCISKEEGGGRRKGEGEGEGEGEGGGRGREAPRIAGACTVYSMRVRVCTSTYYCSLLPFTPLPKCRKQKMLYSSNNGLHRSLSLPTLATRARARALPSTQPAPGRTPSDMPYLHGITPPCTPPPTPYPLRVIQYTIQYNTSHMAWYIHQPPKHQSCSCTVRQVSSDKVQGSILLLTWLRDKGREQEVQAKPNRKDRRYPWRRCVSRIHKKGCVMCYHITLYVQLQ